MFTLRGHRIACGVGVVLFVGLSWHLTQSMMQSDRITPNILVVTMEAMLLGASIAFLTVWVPAWNKLEALTLQGARESVPSKLPNYEEALYQRQQLLGDMLGNRNFRHGLAQSFERATFRYHPTADTTSGVLSIDLLFPKEWTGTPQLIAAIAYICSSRPVEIEVSDATRNETRHGTRVRFTLIPGNKGILLREQADAMIKQWALNISPVTLCRFKERHAQVQAKSVFDIVEHDEVAQMQATKTTNNALAQAIPAITTVFQHDIELKKENLLVTVGYDGKTYYTHFGGKQKREYSNWSDFCRVWGHFDEIKATLEKHK